MKKVFLSMLLMGAVCLVNAQVTVYTTSTTTYPATTVTVPSLIKTNFETTYPAVTVITWEPVSSFWRATYKLDNRFVYVYYTETGVNYKASLPVIQNNVPEEIVNTALNQYGPIVYGITQMKGPNNTDLYQLRLMEKGNTRLVWMDASGTTVTDVFKVKTDEVKLVVNPPGTE